MTPLKDYQKVLFWIGFICGAIALSVVEVIWLFFSLKLA